jgi:hypothetical protein
MVQSFFNQKSDDAVRRASSSAVARVYASFELSVDVQDKVTTALSAICTSEHEKEAAVTCRCVFSSLMIVNSACS